MCLNFGFIVKILINYLKLMIIVTNFDIENPNFDIYTWKNQPPS